MARLETFCYIFPLQMGVVLLNTAGIVLMIITAVVNLYSLNYTLEDAKISQYITMHLVVTTLFLGYVCNFLAGFWEHIDLTICGVNLIAGGFFIWIMLLILSFIVTSSFPIYMWVCVSGVRCPDTIWIFDARWRYSGYECPPSDLMIWPSAARIVNKTKFEYKQINIIQNITDMNITDMNITLWQSPIDRSMFPGCDVGNTGWFIYSILVAAAFGVYMITTIIVGLSYRQELLDVLALIERGY